MNFPFTDPGLLSTYFIATAIAGFVVHVVFALAVLADVSSRRVLCHKVVWAIATLLGGVFVAVAYWLLHHGLVWRGPAYDPLDPPAPPAQ